MPDRSQTPLRKMYLFNRVLKNKHQAVSQGDYGLEAWRLER
jgi:hypothetical protein